MLYSFLLFNKNARKEFSKNHCLITFLVVLRCIILCFFGLLLLGGSSVYIILCLFGLLLLGGSPVYYFVFLRSLVTWWFSGVFYFPVQGRSKAAPSVV